MDKPSPRVDQYMTTVLAMVDVETTLDEARRKMEEHGIHHLPVLQGGRLVGVITDRDTEYLHFFHHHGLKKVQVGAVMTEKPYVVPTEKPLDEVVSEMIARRATAALVMDGERVIGIFTSHDALEALDDALHGHLPVQPRS